MSEPQASYSLRTRNPDVLTCIANLSNDEVFTPPQFANQMLDTLAHGWAKGHDGADIWADSAVTFFDPFTKSGVFLREIAKRLVDGLAQEFPDLNDRVDHILTKQLYGIGITELCALLARRSVYCSKDATNEYSIARSFDRPSGNIWFQRTEHTWVGGKNWMHTANKQGTPVEVPKDAKCQFCRASQAAFDRPGHLENHAYAFIHTSNIKARLAEIFGEEMHFDVIIGNPPYQLSDGGGEGSSAIPLYHEFVEQAKALDPAQLVMVIPARWYSGGKGLDDFRNNMLTDGKLAEVHDFAETRLVFPGVNIRGGVCYFRWSRDHEGPATITNYRKDNEATSATRDVLEPGTKVFVRDNEAISILRKVRAQAEHTYDSRVQSRNPFGIPSNFSSFSLEWSPTSPVSLFRSRRGSSLDKIVYVSIKSIKTNLEFKDRLKVLVSKASPGGDEYPHAVFSAPLIAPEQSVATETYLIVDFPSSKNEAENLVRYMRTRFFRFLVSLIKTTQNISKGCFAFVPVQDLTQAWTDELLYAKYGISEEEAAFIESMIRPMEMD